MPLLLICSVAMGSLRNHRAVSQCRDLKPVAKTWFELEVIFHEIYLNLSQRECNNADNRMNFRASLRTFGQSVLSLPDTRLFCFSSGIMRNESAGKFGCRRINVGMGGVFLRHGHVGVAVHIIQQRLICCSRLSTFEMGASSNSMFSPQYWYMTCFIAPPSSFHSRPWSPLLGGVPSCPTEPHRQPFERLQKHEPPLFHLSPLQI